MSPGKHCPHCRRDIGVWPIFRASLPNRMWCPHCKTRLRYRNIKGLFALVLVIAVVVAVGAYVAAHELAPTDSPGIRLGIFALILLPAWAAVELPVAWYLRHRYELEVVELRSE